MTHFPFRRSGLLALACLTGLTACVYAPPAPRVSVMPTPGKPLELFAQEDQYCRGYAQQTMGPDNRASNAVGAAVVGTIIGAAIGSATSGRHYNNTGAGAATGLMVGSAIGAGNSANETYTQQQRYDIAYEQCMVSKNNQPAHRTRAAPAVVYVPAPQPAPAPAPAYYPPPPPGPPPPPPPQ